MDSYTTVKAPESMSEALQQVEDPLIFRDPEATWIGKATENKELTGDHGPFHWQGVDNNQKYKGKCDRGKILWHLGRV